MQPTPKALRILGVPFSVTSQKEARDTLTKLLQAKPRANAAVFTPNSEILWQAHRDPRLKQTLLSADLLLPDGVGLRLAAKMKGKRIPERVTGIDTGEWLLRLAAKNGLSVYLLGGEIGVAEEAKRRLTQRLPALRICGTHHGYFDKNQESKENQAVLQSIRSAKPDLLFVCLGFPAQERWILENTPSLPFLRLSIGLGGSLDVWSDKVKRAPRAVQACAMEWLWRAVTAPKRLPRLLSLPHFLWAVLREPRGDARGRAYFSFKKEK